jgi:hypothetical protein
MKILHMRVEFLWEYKKRMNVKRLAMVTGFAISMEKAKNVLQPYTGVLRE